MGTSGSGSFSDYPSGKKGSSSTDGSGDGSGTNQNSCEKAIGEIELEEVGSLDYFKTNNRLPNIDNEVFLQPELDDGRMVVLCENLKLGYLPTKYNYLKACMERGFSYGGTVTDSTVTPQPYIQIDIAPIGE